MEDRLAEKLKLAGGVVARQHKKIENRADAVIAREAVIEKKTDKAFLPHETMLDAAEKGLDAFERQLAGLSNDPLQSGEQGTQGEKQTIKPDEVGNVKDLVGDAEVHPIVTAANRQGRPA